jgi:hypothetical protein
MCVRQMRPPGRGDCWILKIAHPPSDKNVSKNGFWPREGVAFLRKAFLQKNFQVRERFRCGRLRSAAVTRLWPRGLRSRRPHSSLIIVSGLLGLGASPSARTRTVAPGEAADWLKSRTRTCAAVKREAEEDLGRGPDFDFRGRCTPKAVIGPQTEDVSGESAMMKLSTSARSI